MAKQTKAQLMATLDGLQVGYKTTDTVPELEKLLKKATKPAPKAPPPVEPVPCGLSTINNHEQRLVVIERKLGLRE